MPISPQGHQITLVDATAMTKLYRENRLDNYPICETFDRAAVELLLSDPACVSFRIYYGMKADMTVHAILVGADQNGSDIITVGNGGDDGIILEDAERCPDACPPPSPLNATY